MATPIIEKAIDLFKSISDLCKKVMDAGDPTKYAQSVEELNQGVSDTYVTMRTIIINSKQFSDEEKLRRLTELAEQESEAKRKCGEAIKGNRENVAKIALDVVMGLLTCGISFAPAILKNLKSALADGKNIPEIDSDALIESSGIPKIDSE